MDYVGKLVKLARQLYPTGRVFNMRLNGALHTLHLALADSENRVLKTIYGIDQSILPDNTSFSEEDATRWEQALGLNVNPVLPLDERKVIILEKMKYPGSVKARQHFKYVEGRLRAVGFDVYVHENIPVAAYNYTIYGERMYGESMYGIVDRDFVVCANYINEQVDSSFDVGVEDNYKATFFIESDTPGTPATVPSERKDEFRQMILRLKPLQTVALLRVNYVSMY